MMRNNTILIYNSRAGKKRSFVTHTKPVSLEDIKALLEQYQIPTDYAPTQHAGHATELAREAVKNNYETILVAGGDGTVGEAANGMIGSQATLGILPLGSFMNVARMLSIPTELEKAVELIKIHRIRKIDVGSMTKVDGDKLTKPYYFLESAGIGLEAHLQQEFAKFEKGHIRSLFSMIATFLDFYAHYPIIRIDDEKEIKKRVSLISVSNGPLTGASLELAPDAKLNDHRLTVTLYSMSKWELLRHLYTIIWKGRTKSRYVTSYQAKKVQIITKKERLVHVDARFYGTTPVEFKIVPNALSVITGFPKDGETALLKRTYLDP